MINAIGVLIDLVFLALFSILLYHLLTHVRMAKIVINFTPIVKDFSPKLRKNTNVSVKRLNILPGKVSVFRWYFFLNEAIFCVDMSNLVVQTKMADEFHAEALRRLRCVRCLNF